jgi:uncharacterized membrane protein YbaN (DUF454 family)
MRIVWLTLGLASLALGGLGVALPLLPTTPFVLLAAYCFARSSRKLHDWLLDNRTFGKAIRDWRAHRAISRRSKAIRLQYIIGAQIYGSDYRRRFSIPSSAQIHRKS